MNNFCVITTINKPTKAIEVLYEKFGSNLIVVGDEKTPAEWAYKDVKYINPICNPVNSYARKNIGYLEAMRLGAELIYDCDDDTIPNENWKIRNNIIEANISDEPKWFNVYKVFSNYCIWPRGFSLKHIYDEPYLFNFKTVNSSIQQGMVDRDPDVDAIYRLVLQSLPTNFTDKNSVYLKSYTWCPFNSQSTFWFPKAYPLMYLPVYSTFRMCDIWRSFVAQRCLWEINEGVTFHSPSEVYQDRNEHDLLKDFEDEIPGYLKNDLIVEILSALKLKHGEENMCENMVTCYRSFVDNDILPFEEIVSVKKWIKEYEEIAANI